MSSIRRKLNSSRIPVENLRYKNRMSICSQTRLIQVNVLRLTKGSWQTLGRALSRKKLRLTISKRALQSTLNPHEVPNSSLTQGSSLVTCEKWSKSPKLNITCTSISTSIHQIIRSGTSFLFEISRKVSMIHNYSFRLPIHF